MSAKSKRKKRHGDNVVQFSFNGKGNQSVKVECLTRKQSQYYLSMQSNPVTFGIGIAGTGKTMVATGLACELLMAKKIRQIVITRPIIGVSKNSLGYLPGTMEDKFDPYFKPVKSVMEYYLGKNAVECMIKNSKIVITPLEFVRGLTFDQSFVIMDEAQNTSIEEMKAFLTRIGQYSTVCINGDIEQTDMKSCNGLADAMYRFKDHDHFNIVRFDTNDIVRSDLVKDVILAYRQ